MEDSDLQDTTNLTDPTALSSQERQLVEAARQGDSEAFGLLYRDNAVQVYRYIAYRVQPPAEAEDLTAQVFLNAWKAIERYQMVDKPFVAWLYTIAHNLVINRAKSKGQNTAFAPIDAAYDLADNNRYSRPDWQADRQADYEELRLAVLKLPYDQQQVIYLRYVEEFDHHKIGQMMGKSDVTVRGILFRAHEALRKTLKREIIFGYAE